MSNDNQPIPVGPHTARLMQKIAAEGAESATFTQEEKLALVADNLMDPKEVGLTTAEEAQLQIMPEAEKTAKFGDAVKFECGVIPLEIRAEWALQDTKLVLAPGDKIKWVEDYIAKHKGEFRIQGYMHCGTALAKFERTYRDPVLGLSQMLHLAAIMLEKRYLGEELPPSTDQKPEEQNAKTDEQNSRS